MKRAFSPGAAHHHQNQKTNHPRNFKFTETTQKGILKIKKKERRKNLPWISMCSEKKIPQDLLHVF